MSKKLIKVDVLYWLTEWMTDRQPSNQSHGTEYDCASISNNRLWWSAVNYKKIWEELIAYFRLIRDTPHRKRRVQCFFYCCLCIFVAPGMWLPSRCLDTTRGIHRATEQGDLISRLSPFGFAYAYTVMYRPLQFNFVYKNVRGMLCWISLIYEVVSCILDSYSFSMPVTVAERSRACNVFARSEAEIVVSNPTQGMDVWCVCAFFCVCVVLCLGRGLATSWSPVQGVLPSVKWSRNWEISPVLQNCSSSKAWSKKRKKYSFSVISKWCCAVTLYWFLGDELYQNRDLFADVYDF
jgi:hypothetical protein